MTNTRKIAFGNEILRGVVGSTAYGTSIDNQGDRDEMGVFIEPAPHVCGLQAIDNYTYRDKPKGVRSEAGDLDLTMYSLRKFCSLASKGNPSVLGLLWLPEYEVCTVVGTALVSMRDEFISKEAGERFLGYLISQKKALKGEKTKAVTRPELVEAFGYDTKFAMHAVRLGLQGVELLTKRRISMPVEEPYRSQLLDIRRGRFDLPKVLSMIEQVELHLRWCVDHYNGRVDLERVNDFLVESHFLHWGVK